MNIVTTPWLHIHPPDTSIERDAVPRLLEACERKVLSFWIITWQHHNSNHQKMPPRKCIFPKLLFLQITGKECEPGHSFIYSTELLANSLVNSTSFCKMSRADITTSPSLLVTTPEVVPVTLRPSLFQVTWAGGWALTRQVMCTWKWG